jgi:hypothetical protein
MVSDKKGSLLICTVAARGQPNHAPQAFFNIAFIPQSGDNLPDKAGIYGLPGERYKLARIVFVTFGQSQQKFFAIDCSVIHGFCLYLRIMRIGRSDENGSRVPARWHFGHWLGRGITFSAS